MRRYETIYILRPDVDEGVHVEIRDRVEGLIKDAQGNIELHESWGRKKLSYYVKKHNKGHFMYVVYAGVPTLVAELERNLRLAEPVIKYQTVRLEDDTEVVRPFAAEPMPDEKPEPEPEEEKAEDEKAEEPAAEEAKAEEPEAEKKDEE